jgi:hypothetical protein
MKIINVTHEPYLSCPLGSRNITPIGIKETIYELENGDKYSSINLMKFCDFKNLNYNQTDVIDIIKQYKNYLDDLSSSQKEREEK